MRFSEIDDTSRKDHHHLAAGDNCFYLWEYTSGRNFGFSKANSIISNLKKKPSNSHHDDYKYKLQAIGQASSTLKETLSEKWLNEATLIPVPGSKVFGHPDYDDRMEKICRGIRDHLDVRNLVRQSKTSYASHEVGPGERITVDELSELYQIDESVADPSPVDIGIFDDVLTAGTHYKAMKTVLNDRFPGVPITGIFIARRISPTEDDV